MMRGRSYGITNFVSRPFASMATIVVEYTNNPLFFVLPLALLAQWGIELIREVDFENGWVITSGSKEILDGKVAHHESALHLNDDDSFMAASDGPVDERAVAIINKVWGEGEIVKVNKRDEIESSDFQKV